MFGTPTQAAQWLIANLDAQGLHHEYEYDLETLELLIREEFSALIEPKITTPILEELADEEDQAYIDAYLRQHLPSYQTDLEMVTHRIFQQRLTERAESSSDEEASDTN